MTKALDEGPHQSGDGDIDGTGGAEGWLASSLIDATREGVTLHDLDGVVRAANTVAAQLLRTTRERLLGRDVTAPAWRAISEEGEVVAPSDHPTMVTLRTRVPCHDVIMGIERPGAPLRWISLSAVPVVDDGQFAAVRAHFIDVTSLVEARRDLRATIGRLALLTEHPADVVVLMSPDGVSEWVSWTVSELLGWQPHEVEDHRVDDLVHPDDLGRFAEYRHLAPGAPSAHFLIRLRRSGGDYRWVSISARRVVETGHEAGRIVSSWRDAQVLVDTHHELEETRERFRFIAENATDVVAETDGDHLVTWVSPALHDILGWRRDDVIGRALSDLVLAEDRPALLYEEANLATGLRPQSITLRLDTASGSPRWMTIRQRARHDERGTVVSNTVSLRDVHAEETMRRELEASEERYRLLADNGADLIVLLAPDDTIRWASPSATPLFGWTPLEMLGRRLGEFVHPEDLADLEQRPDVTPPRTLTLDALRWRRATGDYTWVSVRGREVLDSRGGLHARVITLRDVSRQMATEQRLAESEAHFRMVLENQADVTAQLSLEGRVEWITPSVYDLLGWRAPEVVGMNAVDFVHPLDSPALEGIITRVLAGNVERFEIRLRTLTGELRWVAATAKPLVDAERQTTGSLVNVTDVTARHEALSQLTRSEERFRLALECAPIGIALVDLDRRFVVVNSAMCDMVGRSASWLVEHRIDDVIDPADDDLDLRMRAESLAGQVVHSTQRKRLRRPDQSLVWVQHSIALLRDEDAVPNGFVSTFVNVTNQHAAQERLRYQATHDTLTRLVNRRDFYRRATSLQSRTTRTGENVGFLYIDIDGFKEVNDRFGHHTGDAALRAVAAHLSALGRAEDVVSRVGGDEFVVLLPSLHGIEDAQMVAAKILERLATPLRVDDANLTVSASIGVALARAGEGPDDTLRRADAALYEAKRRGRGQCVTWRSDFDAPADG